MRLSCFRQGDQRLSECDAAIVDRRHARSPASSARASSQLGIRRHAVVPFCAVLDERHAATLAGASDDARRPAGRMRKALERVDERRDVVTVDLDDLPTERPPAIGQRLQAHRSLGPIALLQPVAVDDDRQAVEPVMGRSHRRLPVAALLQLAVSGQHERPDTWRRSSFRRAPRRPQWAGRGRVGPCSLRRPALCCGQDGRSARTAAAYTSSTIRSGKNPSSASVAYSAADACPLLRMNRSRDGIGRIARDSPRARGSTASRGYPRRTGPRRDGPSSPACTMRRLARRMCRARSAMAGVFDSSSSGSTRGGRSGRVHKNAGLVFDAHKR